MKRGLKSTKLSKKYLLLLLLAGVFTFVYLLIAIGKSSSHWSASLRSDNHQIELQSMTLNNKKNFTTRPYNLTNQVRVHKIRKYCADNEYDVTKSFPNYEKFGDLLTGWIWLKSIKHQLFYCATPKCGSTTWKSYILEDMRLIWNTDTHLAATKVLGTKSLFRQGEWTSLLEFLEVYRPMHRLIIVRNPWARLVSAYDDKIVDQKWSIKKMCLAGGEYSQTGNETVSFETFIDCLLKSERSTMWNPHVHPLTSLCGLCHMDYNLIVKLEEMNEGERYLLEKLNFTRTVYVPPRKLKHKTYMDAYKMISAEKIKKLQEIYHYDIELFGYPLSPFD